MGFDPCAAIQRRLVLAPNEEVEVVFLLGQGEDLGRGPEHWSSDIAGSTRRRYRPKWRPDGTTSSAAVRVKTPDRSFDLMINQWLLYQTLACRVLARTAFYQSGGAFGFRDQLQDVMALVVPMRDMTREHLLRAASHQFEEGDVLHWWHWPLRQRGADPYLR